MNRRCCCATAAPRTNVVAVQRRAHCQATEKNACVYALRARARAARMSFVTPHIFLGLASFHFLVISDRFISKHSRGIPSTL